MSNTPMPWIKLHTSLLNDERFMEADDAARARYFELLMLCGKYGPMTGELRNSDDSPLRMDEIAWILRTPIADLEKTIAALAIHGLIELRSGLIVLPDFVESQQYTDRYYGMRKDEWYSLKRKVFERDSHRCLYCGAPAQHVDHLIARVEGGTNDLWNLVSSCAFCNQSKNASPWMNWYRSQPFFDQGRADRIAVIAATGKED